MNVHAPLSSARYSRLLWWVLLSGCAARFSAERSATAALSGFAFWVLVFGACWLVKGLLARGERSTARREAAGNAVAVLGILSFVFMLNSEGLVPALLTFLFAIQAATFIIAHKRLHAWLIIAAAFAGVMFAAAESRSGFFLACAVWYIFASLSVLVFDQRTDREDQALLDPIESSARSSSALQYVALVLAITLPIYLLLPKPAGLLLGGMQASSAQDYREDELAPARTRDLLSHADAGSTAEPSDPIADEHLLPAQPQDGFYGDSFSTSEVERDSGTGNGIVLFVKSSHNVYLRGKLFDRFEANRWHRELHESTEHRLDRGYLEHPAARASHSGNQIQQTIEVAGTLDTVLVHTPGLQRLRFPGPTVRVYDDDVLEVPRALTPNTVYSTESSIALVQGRYALLDQHPLKGEQRYLQLSDDATERVRALAQEIVRDAPDALAKTLLLEKHLRENYQYSYETIPQQGHTPIDAFLFETKRGHCEFFASALAVMLRAVDIPSRVATGFSLGEPNPITGYYEVRALDGHAWVEAYLAGIGWLMLEPTPFYPLPQPTEHPHQVLSETDRYLERLAATQVELNPESLKTAVIVTARDLWMQSRHLLRRIAEIPRAMGWATFYVLMAVAITAVAATAAAAYFIALALADWASNRTIRSTLARSAHAETRLATVMLAAAMEDAATARGYDRRAHWTLREYVGYLATTDHAVPAQFSDLFDASRYSDTVEDCAPHVLVQVRESVQTVVTRNRWPRTQRALKRWQRALHPWPRVMPR